MATVESPPTTRPAALSVAQAAEYLGISTAGVRRAIARGDLRAIRLGARVLLPVADLDAILAGGES